MIPKSHTFLISQFLSPKYNQIQLFPNSYLIEPNQYSLTLIKIFSQEEEETSRRTISSSTSEKIEFSSEITSPSLSSFSSKFPSSRPTNILKGEQQQQGRPSFRRRLYLPRVEKNASNNPLIKSTSTSNTLLASSSRFPASSSSSRSPYITSRSNSRYRSNRTFTPKTKTILNNSHRSQLKRTRHRTASKRTQRIRTRGRGKPDLGYLT